MPGSSAGYRIDSDDRSLIFTRMTLIRGTGYVMLVGGLLAALGFAMGIPMPESVGPGSIHDSSYALGSPYLIGGCVAVAAVGLLMIVLKRSRSGTPE